MLMSSDCWCQVGWHWPSTLCCAVPPCSIRLVALYPQQPGCCTIEVTTVLLRSLFQAIWAQGGPVIVRNCRGKMSWAPDCMLRATRDMGNQAAGTKKEVMVTVLDCANFADRHTMKNQDFFSEYSERGKHRPGALGRAVHPLAQSAVCVVTWPCWGHVQGAPGC